MKICFRLIQKAGLLSALLIIILFVSAQAFAWQGRMAGAGDAYGLYEDESDFLIHPAAIASSGKDINAYSAYRLTYDRTMQRDNQMRLSNDDDYTYRAEGHEWKNQGQAGMAFPFATGRMGIFFDYLGTRAKYNGDENDWASTTNDYNFKLESKADNFNLKTIYGKQFKKMKFGGEIQLSHKNEENSNIFNNPADYIQNYYQVSSSPALDIYKFMIPFRSDYYESLGKLSIEGELGSVKNIFTIKGGVSLPFASNNRYNYSSRSSGNEVSMSGEVNSWNTGFDYWIRFPLNKDMSLPFIVAIWHKNTKRDGSGTSNTGSNINYKHQSEDTNATVGGGADFNLNRGTSIAIGLYYDYLQSSQNMYTREISADTNIYNYPEYPSKKENRVTFKAVTEINFSSGFTFLGGLNAFYGEVKNNYQSYHTRNSLPRTDVDSSTNGYNLGLNLCFGTSFKADKIIFEPFINAGLCKYKVKGDGFFDGVVVDADTTNKSEKTDWIIGGGLSVKY